MHLAVSMLGYLCNFFAQSANIYTKAFLARCVLKVFFKVFSQNSSTFLRASFFLNLIVARFKANKSPHAPPNTLAIFFKKLWCFF